MYTCQNATLLEITCHGAIIYIFLITGRDDVEFHALDVVVVQFGNNSMPPCFGILAFMESA